MRSDAATSAPMNPIPTTTAWVAEAAAARIRSASATVRSWNTPSRSLPGTGSERLRTPVATRQPSNARRSPSVSVSVRARGVERVHARARARLDVVLVATRRRDGC